MIKDLNRKSYFFLRDPKVRGRSQGNRWMKSSNFLLHKKQQHVRRGAERRDLESRLSRRAKEWEKPVKGRHKGTCAGRAPSVFLCMQTHHRHTAQAAKPKRRTSNWGENGKAVELRQGREELR